ncbi:hypothetical protein D3C73_1559560 [compost metagenome]
MPITKPCCDSPAILDSWVPTAGRRMSMARNTMKVTAMIAKYPWTNRVSRMNTPEASRQTEITRFSPKRFRIQLKTVS